MKNWRKGKIKRDFQISPQVRENNKSVYNESQTPAIAKGREMVQTRICSLGEEP